MIKDDILRIFDCPESLKDEVPRHDFKLPSDYSIGVIVGKSGSGKSTILKQISEPKDLQWDERPICEYFKDTEDAKDRLSASGLNTIPSWLRPYNVLSNGEKFRVGLARTIDNNAVVDEFTSLVDRDTAKSCCVSLSKYVKRKGIKKLTLATCHRDILEWLEPDWVYDTDSKSFQVTRGLLRRPRIHIKLQPCSYKAWSRFSEHHYLDAKINKSSRCWLILWGETVVGFCSAIAFPNGSFKNAWRGHRTVVLPEFQGMGIGAKSSDCVAKLFVKNGYKYFSKTANPALGEYRELSKDWKPTSKNKVIRTDYLNKRETKESGHKHLHYNRICYSHEYVGC